MDSTVSLRSCYEHITEATNSQSIANNIIRSVMQYVQATYQPGWFLASNFFPFCFPLSPREGKKRDPGNEVGCIAQTWTQINYIFAQLPRMIVKMQLEQTNRHCNQVKQSPIRVTHIVLSSCQEAPFNSWLQQSECYQVHYSNGETLKAS